MTRTSRARSSRFWWIFPCSLPVSILALACSGEIGEANRTSGRSGPGSLNGQTPGSTSTPGSTVGAANGFVCDDGSKGKVGESPLRRLTRVEYDNTVRDLLGDMTGTGSSFVADGVLSGFENNADQPATTLVATQYSEAAQQIAAAAVKNLATLYSCDTAKTGEAECAKQFVRQFGKRAYRRPLSDTEATRFDTLYSSLRTQQGLDFTTAISAVIEGMLQSPNFVYHIEKGASGPGSSGSVSLTAYEIASRLSYFLWNTMPDAELFSAADAGKLTTPVDVEAEVRRMIADPRAEGAVANFFRQWLDLDKFDTAVKDTTLFPEFTPEFKGYMRGETEAFVSDVFWKGDAKLPTLLTASYSFVNEDLAKIYGIAGITGTNLRRADLDKGVRRGLLSEIGMLAARANADQTSPVKRGKFVRERLFCQSMPAPPPTVNVMAPEPDPKLTTRQRYAAHSTDPYCHTCHQLMDPIGLGFENYDTVGRFRSQENGQPVDASGHIINTRDSDGDFNGLFGLVDKLTASAQVSDCVAATWFTYALSRDAGAADVCSLATLAASFQGSGHDMRDLLVKLTVTDAFRYRPVVAVEASCQ